MHMRCCGTLVGAGKGAMAEACVVLLARAEHAVDDIEMPLLVTRDTLPNMLQVGTIICQTSMPLYIHALAAAVCASQAYALGLYPPQTAVTAHISHTLSAVEAVAYLAAVEHAGKSQQVDQARHDAPSVVKSNSHDSPSPTAVAVAESVGDAARRSRGNRITNARITNAALRRAEAPLQEDHPRHVVQAELEPDSSARSSNEDATQVDQAALTAELILQVLELRKQVDDQTKQSEDLSVQVLDLGKQVGDLTKQSEEMSTRLTCTICLDGEISIMLMPCRHLCTCASCTAHLTKCPLCMEAIADTLIVYIP